jgi:hypothetical protein
MKEDILEQLVDDYLKFMGYFTIHNVKFKPAATEPDYVQNQDAVCSDVDVIGLHPLHEEPDRMWVVSCKSWQDGFDPRAKIVSIERNGRVAGRDAWKSFRELVKPRWANALIAEIQRLTGSLAFTYVTAVTKLKGNAALLARLSTVQAESTWKSDKGSYTTRDVERVIYENEYDRSSFGGRPTVAGDKSFRLDTIEYLEKPQNHFFAALIFAHLARCAALIFARPAAEM